MLPHGYYQFCLDTLWVQSGHWWCTTLIWAVVDRNAKRKKVGLVTLSLSISLSIYKFRVYSDVWDTTQQDVMQLLEELVMQKAQNKLKYIIVADWDYFFARHYSEKVVFSAFHHSRISTVMVGEGFLWNSKISWWIITLYKLLCGSHICVHDIIKLFWLNFLFQINSSLMVNLLLVKQSNLISSIDKKNLEGIEN